MHALTRRRDEVPGDVPLFMRLPGLGPKTAARIWNELGITTLAELRTAAESSGCGRSPGWVRRPRRRSCERSTKAWVSVSPNAGCWGGLPGRAVSSSTSSAPTRPPIASRRLAASGAVRDLSRPRPHRYRVGPAGADGAPGRPPGRARGRRARRHQGDDRHRPGVSRRPPRRPAGELRSSPALFTGSKDHNVASARTPSGGPLGLRVRRHGRRDGWRSTRSPTRRTSMRTSATPSSRPSCARTAASWTWRGRAGCRRSSSSAT